MSSQDKSIRFIDSDYRELFTIPDGADITITYPPEDGRGAITRTCKYLDAYHTKIGGESLHICQFAEIMERLGAKYEPAEQLQGAELIPFSEDEASYLDIRSNEGKTRIGLLSGDFRNQGDRFHANARMNEAQSGRNTPAFQGELHRAVYALRQSLLKDWNTMLDYCHAHPEAKLLERDTFAQYGFKLETEARRYFVLCHVPEAERDARFTVYAYDKSAPLRELVPGTDEDRQMFYRNDDDGYRCVGWLRGDFGRSGHEFHHGWTDRAADQNTPEFKAEFQEIMTLLRRDILKDHASSTDYCYEHPESRLPDQDGYHYGFKLETETRQYFVRCTTLRNDYFYVFAYNKSVPLREREKPSVLDQLRDGKKPPAPQAEASEKKHTRSKHEPTL